MFAEERQKKILELLSQRGSVTVKDLSDMFEVVPITIRRDFEVLEKKGLLMRSHGGAVLVGEPFLHRALPDKETLNHEAKGKIGRRAAELIRDGETVILDEGSTCIEVARAIGPEKSVTVVTNGIKVAAVLIPMTNITTILIGGICGHHNYAAYGHDTVEGIKKVRAHKYFMGIDAIQPGYGISDGDPHQVELKRAKASVSEAVFGVADNSKIGKIAVSRVESLRMLDCLVMNATVPDSFKSLLDKDDVKLIEVD